MDNAIRFAEERDIPALCRLWHICSGDSEEYVRFFYRENLGRITSTVYTVDDSPVSMLHWFDAEFVNGNERRKAKYLYAGGSLPEFRKNGYYGSLIRYVCDYAKENGVALFGKPAHNGLIPYYAKFGLVPDARFRLVTVSPGEKESLKVRDLSPGSYNRMRCRAFGSHPHVEWSDRYVGYCVAENAFSGGRTLAVETDGDVHFLMAAPKENRLLITETDLSFTQLTRLGGALCELFGADVLQAYLPDYTGCEGEEIVSSVIYNAPLQNTYVNLLLI